MGRTNHEWIWDQFLALHPQSTAGAKALDFGCGDGRLITWSQECGIGDFYGTDTFYGDGEIGLENGGGDDIPASTRERISITETGQPLPFADNTFDFVCSNQVFEHIADLDRTIEELARITKPGGRQLHVFPTRERVVEGHLGVAGIHRLPPGRRRAWARRWYPHVRYGDTTSSFEQWWDEMGPFLDNHTVYRTAREYDAAFARYFRVRHIESEKLGYHLQHSRLRSASRWGRVVPRRFELMRATYAVELQPREGR